MNLLTQNSKIKKTSKYFGVKLYNWTLPAYKSKSGKVICAMADKCVDFCYARKGAYIWSNVKSAHEQRYEFSKTDEFVDAMINDILNKKAEYVRVHDGGDYYSGRYMAKWFAIARALPQVRFYSYTNMIEMVLKSRVPDNFDFIFSDSGKQVHLINPRVHRHTKIFSIGSDMNDYVNASEYDLYATKWFSPDNHKVGLFYH
jgi:hypothetical protein